MAKQCAFCGQMLPGEDARFCTNCGQAQPSQAARSVPSSSVSGPAAPVDSDRSPLPPRPQSPATPGMPAGTPRITRASLREQIAQQPPVRVPRRPVPQDPPGWMSQLEPGLSAPVSPERAARLAMGSAAPLAPVQGNSGAELDLRAAKEPAHEESPARRARQTDDQAAVPEAGRAQQPSQPAGPSKHELRVRLWEQEHSPSTQWPEGRQVEYLVPGKQEDERKTADNETVQGLGNREFEAKKSRVEDLPTAHLAVSEPARSVIQRPVTPAPETREAEVQPAENVVEDLPTRPLTANPAASRVPAQRATTFSPDHEDGLEQLETRPLTSNRQTGAPSGSAGAARPLGARQIAEQRKRVTQEPPAPADVPAAPDQPETGLAQRPVMQSPLTPILSPESWQIPQATPPSSPASRQIKQVPAPLTPPIPQPLVPQTRSAGPAASSRRKGRKVGVWIALVLLFLLAVAGVSTWIIRYQPFTIAPVSLPYQAYSNTALGFSLHYPQGWAVRVDAAQTTVHFFDSNTTDQFNVISMASNGQALDQYINKEVAQLGMTDQKSGAPLSFAGTSWQAVQGSVVQSGVSYTALLLVTQRGDHFYAITQLAPASTYNDEERQAFAPIRSAFQFL